MCISIENKSGQFTKAAIKNDELRTYANMLAEDAMNIRENLLHMSAIMAAIAAKADAQKKANEETILAQFNDSITTFGAERLGLKKSQVYSMVNVGTTFLDHDGTPLLTQRGGKWSNTQLMAMLPLAGTGKGKKSPAETLKAAQELVKSGDLKPSLTVAEIKAVVAENRPDAAAKAAKAAKKAEAEDVKAEAAIIAEANIIERKSEVPAGDLVKPENGATIDRVDRISIVHTSDGVIRALVNGKEVDITAEFIDKLVDVLKHCKNYK